MTKREIWLESVVDWNAKRKAVVEAQRALQEAELIEQLTFLSYRASGEADE